MLFFFQKSIDKNKKACIMVFVTFCRDSYCCETLCYLRIFACVLSHDNTRNTKVDIVMAETIDMLPLLSGKCDRISIAYSITPDPVLELGIKFPEAFSVSGLVTNRSGYMHLELSADVQYDAVCARCLAPLKRSQRVSLEKTVADSDILEDRSSDEVVDDYLLIVDGKLDVETPFAEQIMLELPYRILCKEDCAGLCSKCGHDLNDGDCGCKKTEIDPRLAVLAKLLQNSGEDDDQ